MKKSVLDSVSTTTLIVMPQHLNYSETLFGGVLLAEIDKIAAICATRHSRSKVVTASLDQMDFIKPAHLGDYVILEGSVTFTSKRSMEIKVTAQVEKPMTGESHLICQAFLTFVALNENNKVMEIPQIITENPEQDEAFNQGKARYEHRKSLRQKGK